MKFCQGKWLGNLPLEVLLPINSNNCQPLLNTFCVSSTHNHLIGLICFAPHNKHMKKAIL